MNRDKPRGGTEQEYNPLRTEAEPVRWTGLTLDQKNGLEKLVNLIYASVNDLNHRDNPPSMIPWLSENNRSRLTFIDGRRGTGKTTLMLTLCKLISGRTGAETLSDIGFGDDANPDESHRVQRLIRMIGQIRNRVIVLEPLDMEPLPSGTPILSAILARIQHAANLHGVGSLHGAREQPKRGLLDGDPRDNTGYIKFIQAQTVIARSLDGNLEARKGGLDREQFAVEVLRQEEDRLRLNARLSDSLQSLSSSLWGLDHLGEESNASPHLFLVPIDDVDLNPRRCLELLRLLRHFSVPQLYFLLMGQRDLVESIVRLDVSSEYFDVGNPDDALSPNSKNELCKRLAEVAIANLQKQLSDVVKVPEMSLQGVLDFKPLGGRGAGHYGSIEKEIDGQESARSDSGNLVLRPSIGDLFARIRLPHDRFSANNLRALLEGECNNSLPRCAAEFSRGQYPGLGAFEITARRLVDLWRWLMEELHGYTSSNPRDLDQEILKIFERHWERLIDEDPLLNSDARTKLRIPTTRCDVVGNRNNSFHEYEIAGVTQTTQADEWAPTIEYRPTLRIADYVPGSGVSHLRIKDSSDTLVTYPQTCCGYVLMNDLRAALFPMETRRAIESFGDNSPVSVFWTRDPDPIRIHWPVPNLPTFAARAEYFSRLKSVLEFSDSSNERSSDGDWGKDAEKLWSGQVSRSSVEKLIQRWMFEGSALLSGKQYIEPSEGNWKSVMTQIHQMLPATDLRKRHLHSWAKSLVLMCMPESCGLDLATRTKEDDDQQLSDTVQDYLNWIERNIRELMESRYDQLFPLWKRHPGLWTRLNEMSKEESWISLRTNPPPVETVDQIKDFRNKIGEDIDEFQTEVRAEIKTMRDQSGRAIGRLEFRIKRDNQLDRFNSRIRQACEIQSSTQPSKEWQDSNWRTKSGPDLRRISAKVALNEALEIASDLAKSVDDDFDFAGSLRGEFDSAAARLAAVGIREEASKLHEIVVELARKASQGKDASINADLILSSALLDYGHSLLDLNRFGDAERQFKAAREAYERLLNENPEDDSVRTDLAVSKALIGVAAFEQGKLQFAESCFDSSIRSFESLPRVESQSTFALSSLAETYNRLASNHLAIGKRSEAMNFYQRSAQLYTRLINRDSKETGAKNRLALVNLSMAAMLFEANEIEKAEERFLNAKGFLESLLELDVTDQSARQSIASLNVQLGQFYAKTGRVDQGRSLVLKGSAELLNLVERDPDDRSHQLLAVSAHNSRGDLYRQLEDFDAALREFNQGLDLCNRRAEEDSIFLPARRELLVFWERLAELYSRNDQEAPAQTACEEAFDVGNRLTSQYPDFVIAKNDLFDILIRKGDMAIRAGELIQAKSFADRADKLVEELIQTGRENKKFLIERAEAFRLTGDWHLRSGNQSEAAKSYRDALFAIENAVGASSSISEFELIRVTILWGLAQSDTAAETETLENRALKILKEQREAKAYVADNIYFVEQSLLKSIAQRKSKSEDKTKSEDKKNSKRGNETRIDSSESQKQGPTKPQKNRKGKKREDTKED